MRAEGTRQPGSHSGKGCFSPSPDKCLPQVPRAHAAVPPGSWPRCWGAALALGLPSVSEMNLRLGLEGSAGCGRFCGPGPGLLGSVLSSSRTPSPSCLTPSPPPLLPPALRARARSTGRIPTGLRARVHSSTTRRGQTHIHVAPALSEPPPGGPETPGASHPAVQPPARPRLRGLAACAGTACSPPARGRLTPEPNRLEWLVLKFLFVSMGPGGESGRGKSGGRGGGEEQEGGSEGVGRAGVGPQGHGGPPRVTSRLSVQGPQVRGEPEAGGHRALGGTSVGSRSEWPGGRHGADERLRPIPSAPLLGGTSPSPVCCGPGVCSRRRRPPTGTALRHDRCRLRVHPPGQRLFWATLAGHSCSSPRCFSTRRGWGATRPRAGAPAAPLLENAVAPSASALLCSALGWRRPSKRCHPHVAMCCAVPVCPPCRPTDPQHLTALLPGRLTPLRARAGLAFPKAGESRPEVGSRTSGVCGPASQQAVMCRAPSFCKHRDQGGGPGRE